MGVRQAIGKLRDEYWTPDNWLELRLSKYLSTGIFRAGHKLFSMLQNKEGVWEHQELVPVPKNKN